MIRLGIVGASKIAESKFMPAAKRIENLKVVCVSNEHTKNRLESFCEKFNIEKDYSFEHMISRCDIDAVYIPQPPALHYKWAKCALEKGKHVLIEKPSTTDYSLSAELIEIARRRGLAFHENYMFQYHSQLKAIKDIIESGYIGEVRLYKMFFGFPLRTDSDFRYSEELGGGSLLDAGGYPIKLATMVLGDSIKVDTSKLNYLPGFNVDMYGSATLSNDEGKVAQIGFGMDCSYQCSLEIWGNKGSLKANRIFTASDTYQPEVEIITREGTEVRKLMVDSHFQRSIEQFIMEIKDEKTRQDMYKSVLTQAKLVDQVREMAKN